MTVPTLEETLRDVLDAEATYAQATLRETRGPDTAVKLAVKAGQRAERTFLPVFQTVACKRGCGHCCHGVRIDVTPAEALTIARGFRETMPPEHVLSPAAFTCSTVCTRSSNVCVETTCGV